MYTFESSLLFASLLSLKFEINSSMTLAILALDYIPLFVAKFDWLSQFIEYYNSNYQPNPLIYSSAPLPISILPSTFN